MFYLAMLFVVGATAENDGQCPASHPYVYYNGGYCCQTNKENVYPDQGDKCDGSDLQIDSLCCEGHNAVSCPSGNCVNYSGAEKYTLKVLCDDIKTVYVDGVRMDDSGSQGWTKISTHQISLMTRVIGIKCHNNAGGHGIKVQVEGKTGHIVLNSDNDRWKCSNQQQNSTAWTGQRFVEDQPWAAAVYTSRHPTTWPWAPHPNRTDLIPVGGEVIWTSETTSVNETVYCRSERQLPIWSGKEFLSVNSLIVKSL
ncbi:hypothetical protein ACHWQZ_G014363 [Mnemiopsis leidyi]